MRSFQSNPPTVGALIELEHDGRGITCQRCGSDVFRARDSFGSLPICARPGCQTIPLFVVPLWTFWIDSIKPIPHAWFRPFATIMVIVLGLIMSAPAARADETPHVTIDLREYLTKGEGVQLFHLIVDQMGEATNLYLLRDQRGIFVGDANHLWETGDGWRFGPSYTLKRNGASQIGLVTDLTKPALGGEFYGWAQLRTPWPRGRTELALDPLQLTWSVGSSVTAGIRSTIVLTSGRQPFVGVGPAISAKLGASTTLDVHYYSGPQELRLQLVQSF